LPQLERLAWLVSDFRAENVMIDFESAHRRRASRQREPTPAGLVPIAADLPTLPG